VPVARTARRSRPGSKAPDVGFYTIEYGFQPGANGRSKRGQFDPDFFLMLVRAAVVVA
jgi:hypothetical protein